MLHGWGSNSERWTPIAEEISKKGFKVIVPDLPGFGKSDALSMPWNGNKYTNWVEDFIKELNLGEFYLSGHSFGGALAAKVAIKHVQEVNKLFLISAACVRKKTTQKNFSTKISKVVKFFSFLPYYSFFRKAVYKFIIRKSDYVYVEGIMKETYLNVIAEDLSFKLPFIKVPTVIIWGDKDEFTPPEDAYFIEKQIKNSKLIMITGAGHDLNRKQPEIVVEKVLENI
ncbi:MAG: alpha/beta hydrolase [Candidatus Staskawiczbacteria bacterium]|nr:alpha/beta hydrolase [Candidatus Staskawiczbacteria bacterium]